MAELGCHLSTIKSFSSSKASNHFPQIQSLKGLRKIPAQEILFRGLPKHLTAADFIPALPRKKQPLLKRKKPQLWIRASEILIKKLKEINFLQKSGKVLVMGAFIRVDDSLKIIS